MVMCFYGRVAVVHTSWTSTNPGRRFHSCPQQGYRCIFLGWTDPPMCARSMLIIPIIEKYQQCKLSSGKTEDVFVCKLGTICGSLGIFHLRFMN
uniref:GRF-type domain-containing protein n=1 Tax=Lactuca sativa TaxID=4236 RepID=A0A9R1XVA9_LACSA|nr:hypothetical protein LSAT_V11C100021930 [Lactuca sativa]